jgi:hypothetical protein
MWSLWVLVGFKQSEGDLAQQKEPKMQENLKTENVKSGLYSIPIIELLIMMTTGHIGNGWSRPDGGATAHNRHIG